MRRPLVPLLTLAIAGAALAADPIDSVDLEVIPRARVRGTLRPAEERESFFVSALRGSRVRAIVRKQGVGGPIPRLELLDAVRSPLAAGTPTRTGARLKGIVTEATAGHVFRVAGAGAEGGGDGVGADGDYRLDITLTPRALWTETSVEDLGAGAEAAISFAAAEGAKATIDLLPAKKSAFRPLLLDVTDSFGGVTPADEGAAKPKRHRVVVTVGASGEQTVRFRNAGEAAGGWRVIVRLRAKPPRRATTDIRDGELGGPFDGAQAVFGRIADDDHVTVIEAGDGLNLSGVAITVPSGAVAFPTLITMTESAPFFVDDVNHTAGTAVSFQPSGTAFESPVEISVPYDPDAFDDDDDAKSALAIVVEDPETGAQETISPSDVDAATSTATFPASHFSRFQPVSPRARPLRGRFVEVELTGRTDDRFATSFTFGRNGLTVNKGPRTAGPATRTLRRFTLGWGLDKQDTPTIVANYDEQVALAVAQVSSDDAVVVQELGSKEVVPLARGRGGDALAATTFAPGVIRLHAMLRRARGSPTRTNLAGVWRAQVLDLDAGATRDGLVATLLASQELDLTVDVKGRVTASNARTRFASQIFPDGQWKAGARSSNPKPGTIEPSGADALLSMRLGTSAVVDQVTLSPVLRGDILIGGGSFSEGPAVGADRGAIRIVVLERNGSRIDASSLPASLLVSTFTLQADTSAKSAPQTLRFATTTGGLSLFADGSLRFSGNARVIGHDAGGLADASLVPIASTGAYRVAADGAFDAGKGFTSGLFTEDLSALLLFAPSSFSVPFGFGLPAPPSK